MASSNHPVEHSPAEDSSNAEKAQDDGPPKPVHFFHPALNRVRREVLFLWLKTSKLHVRGAQDIHADLTLNSTDPSCLYPRRSFHILGSAIPRVP